MEFIPKVEHFRKVVHSVSPALNWVTCVALVAMMLLGSANIILRLFHRPIFGIVDVISLLGAIVIFFAWAYTEVQKGHISIGLVVSRFPQRSQAIIDSITCFLSVGICALLVWQLGVYGMRLWHTGETSPTLELRYFPIVLGAGFCCAVLCLVFVIELIESIAKVKGK